MRFGGVGFGALFFVWEPTWPSQRKRSSLTARQNSLNNQPIGETPRGMASGKEPVRKPIRYTHEGTPANFRSQ
jgi:hypothetical protein